MPRRHNTSARATARNDTALMPKTMAGPDATTMMPAMAGPIARAPFTVMLPSDDACGSSSRGTNSGWIACQAGPMMAAAQPRMKVKPSSSHGPSQPAAVTTVRATAMAADTRLRVSSSRLRFTRSAATPANRDSSNTGRVPAVCTHATRAGLPACSTRNHWAPTLCIQLPMFDTSWATKSIRKTGRRRTAKEPPPDGRAFSVFLPDVCLSLTPMNLLPGPRGNTRISHQR
ncbi:hypothetical protein FAM14222p2_000064 [Propionibacterium freudenreichii]|nr:hypothetical protein [Propionibacterium freudenreichii]